MTKETIPIKPEDLPKHRDPNIVPLISRKKGPMVDEKKKANKNQCRKKVDEND